MKHRCSGLVSSLSLVRVGVLPIRPDRGQQVYFDVATEVLVPKKS